MSQESFDVFPVSDQARPTYPSIDITRAARIREEGSQYVIGARVTEVLPESPADDAGFTPGCLITHVNDEPLRDLIEWRWHAADFEIDLRYIDTDGDSGEITLYRDFEEEWGFKFEGLVFDNVLQCRNNCLFCFMRQLPPEQRSSLTLRDDDYRLSFLIGTFVTLSNVTPEDEQRIIEKRISPLNVSLHVSNPEVRRHLIGRFASHGIAVLDRLLDAGIEVHAQIVLVPEVNDGEILQETLSWAYERPGIIDIGIVPLGYTSFQKKFNRSFNEPYQALEVLDVVKPFQKTALAQRGMPWVFVADEFYINAYQQHVLEHFPARDFYGTFSLFEDGIGISRSVIDSWEEASKDGVITRAASALRAHKVCVHLIAGYALKAYLPALISREGIGDVVQPLFVKNKHFGGNVNVTGLLVGEDISNAVAYNNTQQKSDDIIHRYLLFDVTLNDDNVLLDDMTMQDIERRAGVHVDVVSCFPYEYFKQIEDIACAVSQ